jgi:hypothetical protein
MRHACSSPHTRWVWWLLALQRQAFTGRIVTQSSSGAFFSIAIKMSHFFIKNPENVLQGDERMLS